MMNADADKFEYKVQGAYVVITGYKWENEVFFTEENDGKYYYHITVPELIEGMPVVAAEQLKFNIRLKAKDFSSYRHNGNTEIKIHLPEYTAFKGLSEHRNLEGYLYVPNFSVDYYDRTHKFLFSVVDGTAYFAKKLNDECCEIVLINNLKTYSTDWVWEKSAPNNSEELVVPDTVEGLEVVSILDNATAFLSKDIKVIRIPDTVISIGNNCFCNMPSITDVYLGKKVSEVGEKAFAYYEEGEFIRQVPPLTVHCLKRPNCPESAFLRCATKEYYEEHADWGNMYAGSTKVTYEVIFQEI